LPPQQHQFHLLTIQSQIMTRTAKCKRVIIIKITEGEKVVVRLSGL
jgi:hypothetical protein